MFEVLMLIEPGSKIKEEDNPVVTLTDPEKAPSPDDKSTSPPLRCVVPRACPPDNVIIPARFSK